MQPNFGAARHVLKNEGVLPLAKKSALYLSCRTGVFDERIYKRSVKDVKERMAEEDGLDDILDTILDVHPGVYPYHISAMQLRKEIWGLTTMVAEQEPETILEIGTANGGTFYVWSRFIDSCDTLVSLDLPGGDFGGGYEANKIDLYRQFDQTKEMTFIRDNSHDEAVYERAAEAAGGEVDFLFIDGDHTYDGVKQDFEMYSELVCDGGIIALHDIVNDNEEIEVPQFWEELEAEYNTEKFVDLPNWGGIGVVKL